MASQKRDRSRRVKLLLARLWNKRRPIAWIFYILGLVTFGLLPLAAQKIYMDEKALLVGLTAASSGSSVKSAATLAAKLSRAFPHPTNLAPLVSAAETSDMPTQAWHIETLNGVDNNSCTAAFTVVPGKRSDGTEALLLALPVNTRTPSAAALSVSSGVYAARHFAAAPWLAKDVVLIFLEQTATCSSSQILQRWLEKRSSSIDTSNNSWAERRPAIGLIQQALVLDISSIAAKEARLGVHGSSGQLPNLDMLVMVKRSIDYYTTLPVGLDIGGAPAVRSANDITRLRTDIRTVAAFTGILAAGRSTGPHAALLQYGIDAVTVTLTDDNNEKGTASGLGPPSAAAGFEGSARHALAIIEMAFRSCNNLQERLHHASALYLLVSAERFVNIGAYIVPPALLLAALLIFAGDALHSLSLSKTAKSDFEAGWTRALIVHGLIGAIAVCLEESQKEGVINLRSTGTAVAVVLAFAGSLWKYSSLCTSDDTKIKNKKKDFEGSSFGFLGASLALLVVEAAALLLLRWALCFAFLALALPLHQLSIHFF